MSDMEPFDRALVFNPQSYALGYDSYLDSASVEGAKHWADSLVSRMSGTSGLLMIADHMDESLVMLRRFMCWELDDIAVPPPSDAGAADRLGLTAADKAAVRKHSAMDQAVFEKANSSFWQRVSIELAFNDEVRCVTWRCTHTHTRAHTHTHTTSVRAHARAAQRCVDCGHCARRR
jgi:hypothetical protein